jgi:hypothetical protein
MRLQLNNTLMVAQYSARLWSIATPFVASIIVAAGQCCDGPVRSAFPASFDVTHNVGGINQSQSEFPFSCKTTKSGTRKQRRLYYLCTLT